MGEKSYGDKKVGKNIQAIRIANKKSRADFACDMVMSESTLEKLESGERSADDYLGTISKKTGFSIGIIKNGDLSILEKGDMSFEEIPITEFEDLFFSSGFFSVIFPFVESTEACANENFSAGMTIIHNIIPNLTGTFYDFIEAINCFNRAFNAKECSDYSAINILSCFGYIYFGTIYGNLENISESKKISSFSDYCSYYSSRVHDKPKSKASFLQKYNGLLTLYMKKLIENTINSDYAYYYLSLRYLFGMMDETITCMNEDEMRVFGESLLDSLNMMGNKYAKAYFDFWEAP